MTIQSAKMRKILVLAIVAILLSISIAGGLVLSGSGIVGWNEADLVSPTMNAIEHPAVSIPGPLTSSHRESSWILEWLLSEIYVTYGGVAWISLNNTGSNPLFVYGLSMRWTDTAINCSRPANALIEAGETVEIGMLSFAAPSTSGHHLYSIQLEIAVGLPNGMWFDSGSTSISREAQVIVATSSTNFSTYHNSPKYFDKINKLVDFSITAAVAQEIKDRFPGEYSMMQIVGAYEWVRRNIQYVTDAEDYWQSANETLSMKTGDCEDQAILLVSLIGELGGNGRVNVIEGHAFPTVFVGKNASVLPDIRDAVASYYWVNATSLHLTYFSDESGIWLVIDSVGVPYAGGLPSLSVPSPSLSWGDSWTFQSSTWCHAIDANGMISGGGWLPFL